MLPRASLMTCFMMASSRRCYVASMAEVRG
jgi:hypothetical protein